LNVDGVVTTDGATHDGDVTFTGASYNAVWDKSDNALEFGDNAKAKFGTGGDLEIYHTGSTSHIADVGTGSLFIDGTNLQLRNGDGSKVYAFFTDGQDVILNYNNAQKLATTSSGIDVTGTTLADEVTANNGGSNTNIRLQNTNSGSGSTDGFLIQHATNAITYIWNYENADTVCHRTHEIRC